MKPLQMEESLLIIKEKALFKLFTGDQSEAPPPFILPLNQVEVIETSRRPLVVETQIYSSKIYHVYFLKSLKRLNSIVCPAK